MKRYKCLKNLTKLLNIDNRSITKTNKKKNKKMMMNDDNIDRCIHWIVQKAIRQKEINISLWNDELFHNDIC